VEEFPVSTPNYLSVMSYSWMFRTAWPDDLRLATATCLPFYYADKDAKEASGSVHENVNTIVDYSEGMAKPVKRPTPAAGASVCGITVDWTIVDPDSEFTEVKDFANWAWLKYYGPAKDGNLVP
jgi:hypothetical protein